MSGKPHERKPTHKGKSMEVVNRETMEPVTAAPVKKKLKPYTKPHAERPIIKHYEISPHKLVEIYHNNAAKESDSDEDKHRARIQVKVKTDAIPRLNISGHECGDCKGTKHCTHMEDEGYEEPQAPRAFYNNRNYELPTIASKMKQAVKLDFNMFNFKAIPFCPVSSTTPSHNIGINIQQVMSIIKTRQPVQGISPTLAHNINLAAEKLNQDPLNSFVSSMTSKVGGFSKNNCPLNKYPINYRQLEEMARNVPEEEIAEMGNMEDDVAGPSGDTIPRNPQGPHQWTPDARRNCTCAPPQGVDFNHVYNKYRMQPVYANVKNHYPGNPPSSAVQPMGRAIPTGAVPRHAEDYSNMNQIHYLQDNIHVVSPINGKEKSLKDVLVYLHDDFEAMNKRYELLSNQVNPEDAPKEMMDELEKLEQQLNKKEEEITIVMSLYKEVLALKEQVKALRKCSADQATFRKLRPEDYSSKTAQHITKLLQQIQQFHAYYKKGQNAI